MGIWSWLADNLYFILSYEAGFYKPTLLKVHPPFDPDECCLKNGLLSWGLNPQPLSDESSAITTRPRLLA